MDSYNKFLTIFCLSISLLDLTKSSVRNLTLYPVCTNDKECKAISKNSLCFQYMCYPWQTSTNFRWCNKDSDCDEMTESEGGDENGAQGGCFRHQDRVNINFGICLRKSETKKCQSHTDCVSPLMCTNSYCGDPLYYKELKNQPCQYNKDCQDRLTGDMCCYDLSSPNKDSSWDKKCCNNPSGSPVMKPPRVLSNKQMEKLDRGIAKMKPLFLENVICEALDYSMMMRLRNCQQFLTTTSKRPRQGSQTSKSNTIVTQIVLIWASLLLVSSS